jgi:UDP-N-acetylglucosamine 2-epimerase (non-hydrolysing)
LREVINRNIQKIEKSNILEKLNLKSQKYILVSAHRQENIDFVDRFEELLKTLKEVSMQMKLPVLVSTHPRTKKILDQKNTGQMDSIVFHDPFNFSDYNKLQKEALVVLSDSGTISEESSMLNFKAITIRNSMERPEALEAGSIVMAGIKSDQVLEALRIVVDSPRSQTVPEAYKIEDCSVRTTNFILSTIHEYKFWNSLY